MAKQEGDRGFAGQFRRLRPVLVDPGHVDVGDEVVGIGTLEHENLEGVVSLGSLDEGDQIADQFGSQKIHGRGGNVHEQNGPLLTHGERLEVHGKLPSVVPTRALRVGGLGRRGIAAPEVVSRAASSAVAPAPAH